MSEWILHCSNSECGEREWDDSAGLRPAKWMDAAKEDRVRERGGIVSASIPRILSSSTHLPGVLFLAARVLTDFFRHVDRWLDFLQI